MSQVLRRQSPTRLLAFFVAMTAAGVPRVATAQAFPPTPVLDTARERELTLAELLAHAEEHAPVLQVAVRREGRAEAARQGARLRLSQNPTLEFGIGPRFDGEGDRDFDFYAALGQPFEVAGERGLRQEAVSRMGDRLGAEVAAARWELRRDVVLAFVAAVVARERIALAERMEELAVHLVAIARRRLSAGEVTAIDVRLTEVDHAAARRATLAAAGELRAARLRLAEVTGWTLEAPPNVVSDLGPPDPVPSLEEVLALARDRHPELLASRAAVAEAHARAELADREPWPSPALGVQIAREGSAGSPANYIVLGTLGTSLPFWQRNQGERAERRVDEEVARAEEDATSLALRARIARAHARCVSASERLALFTTAVEPMLAEALALLERGFDAGELPLATVAVARERFLAAGWEGLSTRAEYFGALAELEFAVGAELPVASPATSVGGAP